MTAPIAPQAMTIRQFCATYGVGRTLAYQEIAEGRLAARKAGKRTLVLVVDADSWATALPSMPASKNS
jgi:hypothetical protein